MSAIALLAFIAIVTTIGFGWCAIGWYFSHEVLREISACDESCWPQVRTILRQKVVQSRDIGER